MPDRREADRACGTKTDDDPLLRLQIAAQSAGQYVVGTPRPEEEPVRLSTRNQLAGTVTAINVGSVMTTVKVDVSGQEVTAAVTREAVDDLGLTVGAPVTVLVKSTEVMLAVDD